MRLPTKPILGALLLTIGLSGLAAAQPGPPYPGVPALREERIPPPPPGARMVWEPGHWRWTGASYAWIGGHYARPGRYSNRWVHGHWANRGGRWVWVEPHWE